MTHIVQLITCMHMNDDEPHMKWNIFLKYVERNELKLYCKDFNLCEFNQVFKCNAIIASI